MNNTMTIHQLFTESALGIKSKSKTVIIFLFLFKFEQALNTIISPKANLNEINKKKRMKQSFENGRNSNNNIFNNNKPAQNILEIKTVKTKSFFDTSNKVEDIKKQNVIKKNESKNNKFIQVNTKRKNVFLNNYDLNKVIFIQRYIKIKYAKNKFKNGFK